MTGTLALLEKALKIQKAAAWARDLALDPSAFAQAKKRGHLSPGIAGALAQRLHEDQKHWIAVAAVEAEAQPHLKAELMKAMRTW